MMGDWALSKEALESLFVGAMAVYGTPHPVGVVTARGIFDKREARLAFGLRIPLEMMVEEDCQYVEIAEFGV
jgi:hypothetical protein